LGSCGDERRVGVLGATSLVGACLLPLLEAARWRVVAFTRRAGAEAIAAGSPVEWRSLAATGAGARTDSVTERPIACWVCLAPIWVLPDYFGMLKRFGAKRVVALSSTSVLTKERSPDPAERALARRLAGGESRLAEWGWTNGIEATILRSTLIYGLGRDKNISAIARFIRRFGFFPLLSAAQGLRQPVHADDIAAACVAALQQPHVRQSAYDLSGGETLTYRDMVARVFAALHKPVRFVSVPAWMFRLALAGLRALPRFHHWSPQMAERMNVDLVFSHSDAARDLAFVPRPFVLKPADLPTQ
jgi:nucleoside-diphosphate-sugar epimerase